MGALFLHRKRELAIQISTVYKGTANRYWAQIRQVEATDRIAYGGEYDNVVRSHGSKTISVIFPQRDSFSIGDEEVRKLLSQQGYPQEYPASAVFDFEYGLNVWMSDEEGLLYCINKANWYEMLADNPFLLPLLLRQQSSLEKELEYVRRHGMKTPNSAINRILRTENDVEFVDRGHDAHYVPKKPFRFSHVKLPESYKEEPPFPEVPLFEGSLIG